MSPLGRSRVGASPSYDDYEANLSRWTCRQANRNTCWFRLTIWLKMSNIILINNIAGCRDVLPWGCDYLDLLWVRWDDRGPGCRCQVQWLWALSSLWWMLYDLWFLAFEILNFCFSNLLWLSDLLFHPCWLGRRMGQLFWRILRSVWSSTNVEWEGCVWDEWLLSFLGMWPLDYKQMFCPRSLFLVSIFRKKQKQAGAELCQAKHNLS